MRVQIDPENRRLILKRGASQNMGKGAALPGMSSARRCRWQPLATTRYLNQDFS